MHNKTLQEQYINFFSKYNDFINVKGAANYECPVVNGTGEDCLIKNIRKYKNMAIPHECGSCEYKHIRESKNTFPHIITNYSYYLVSTMYAKSLDPRLITIYDEIHVLNDIFANHMSIHLTVKLFGALLKILKTVPLSKELTNFYNQKIRGFQQDIQMKRITTKNYMEFLDRVYALLLKITTDYDNNAGSHYLDGNTQLYKMYNKASKRFVNLHCKYDDYIKYEYEHVVDIKEDKLSISPIFISSMFGDITISKYHLFMSATINDYFMEKTFDIDENDIEFIKSPPVFPIENKAVVFLNHDSYNYNNMKNWNTLKDISNLVYKLVSNHKHQKGIILTSSFNLNDIIAKNLEFHKRELNIQMFKQIKGVHLSGVLKAFKDYNKPAVLVSPTIF